VAEEGETTGKSPVRLRLARVAVFHFVCLGWLFFRADTVGDAFRMLGGLGNLAWQPEYLTALKFLVLFTVPLFLLDLRMERHAEEYPFEKTALRTGAAPTLPGMSLPARASYRRRVAVAGGALLLVALFAGSNADAFIYFQF
jgi:hypothetical protein